MFDALRREGYRDVYVQTSDDPSTVALVRLIVAGDPAGIQQADAQEWYLMLSGEDGRALLSWALVSGTGAKERPEDTSRPRVRRGGPVALGDLAARLCDAWKQGGYHLDPDDPVADALVINTLFATTEFVNAAIAAAESCKRSNGRPALWVALRQMVAD